MRQLALMENYLKRFFDLGKAMQVRAEPLDLAALVDETVALLRPQCQHANIALEVDAAPARKINGDAGQLRQVLFNLISNAIDAAGPGGRVLVRMRAAEGTVVLDVVDSGPACPTWRRSCSSRSSPASPRASAWVSGGSPDRRSSWGEVVVVARGGGERAFGSNCPSKGFPRHRSPDWRK